MAFPQPGVTAEQSADRLEGGGAARFRQALAPEPDQFRRELVKVARLLPQAVQEPGELPQVDPRPS
jgi:hypothetical protein